MSAAQLYLGVVLGMLASGVHVLLCKRRLSGTTVWAYLLGGAGGGLLAATALEPSAPLSRNDVLLLALAGYFIAEITAVLVGGKGSRA